jgi:hypothetical protein
MSLLNSAAAAVLSATVIAAFCIGALATWMTP